MSVATQTQTVAVDLEFTSYALLKFEAPIGATPAEIRELALAAYQADTIFPKPGPYGQMAGFKITAIGDEEFPDAEWEMS